MMEDQEELYAELDEDSEISYEVINTVTKDDGSEKTPQPPSEMDVNTEANIPVAEAEQPFPSGSVTETHAHPQPQSPAAGKRPKKSSWWRINKKQQKGSKSGLDIGHRTVLIVATASCNVEESSSSLGLKEGERVDVVSMDGCPVGQWVVGLPIFPVAYDQPRVLGV